MPTNDVSLADFLILDKNETALIRSFCSMARKGIASVQQDEAILDKQKLPSAQAIGFFDKSKTVEVIRQELRQKIKKMDLGCLIKAAILDPSVDAVCKQPVFDEVWNERWRQCGRKKTAELPAHEYKPQKMRHTFDLLKGIYIYGKYKSALKNEATAPFAPTYLDLAAELGFFAALNAQVSYFMKTRNQQYKAFIYALNAAELYWTPGYLLLTVVYINQGRFQEALLSLIIAEKLIPYSEAMIINAYQGKSLEAILLPLMKGFGVRDWTEAKIRLAELANLPMSFVTNTLYSQAAKVVKDLQSTANDSQPVVLFEVSEPDHHDNKSVSMTQT